MWRRWFSDSWRTDFEDPGVGLHLIHLDLPEWDVREATAERIVWWHRTSPGDGLSLNFCTVPPDLPGPLDDVTALRNSYRRSLGPTGGIVSVDVVTVAGLRAVRSIFKVPQQPSGMVYVGSLTFPFRSRSYVVKVQCQELGVTGMRDAIVLDRELASGRVRVAPAGALQGLLTGWAADSYDPHATGPVLRNLSDDELHDGAFPQHPLSRVRRYLDAAARGLRFDPEVRTLHPF
jgi:hypothetical protein